MEEHRGKMKNTKFVILMLFLGFLGAKKAAALPAFNFTLVLRMPGRAPLRQMWAIMSVGMPLPM
jgi:hypothetical protein